MSDVTYSGKAVTTDIIKGYITDGTATITVKESTETDETLIYGEDYEIVTEVSDEFKTATGSNEISGANNVPSAGEAYFYIKGILPYSGYKKVSFNIVLDINSAYATVSIASSNYDLAEDGTVTSPITPIINYKTTEDPDETYSGVISNPLNYVTVTRARDGLPGPDENITVKGNGADGSICKGTYTNAKYVEANGEKSTVYFRADLSNYKGITMTSGTVYTYTGEAVTVTFDGLEGTEKVNEALQGDYYIVYTTDYANYSSSSINPVDVGKYYAVIVPTSDSKYFIPGKTSEDSFEFRIKYNLSDSNTVVKYYSGSVEVDRLPYTGSAITVPAVIYAAYGKDKQVAIYDYKTTNSLVTLDPSTVTLMGDYSIVATAKDTDYVYGRLTSKFTVSGVDIAECTITLSGDSFAYTGSAIEPTVTVKHSDTTLKKNTDYTISYSNNIDAGTGKVVIKGINAYSGAVEKEFTISPVEITPDMITVSAAYYSGRDVAVEPSITVKLDSYTLKEGTDYTTPVYANNTWARDDAVVTISAGTGGNFTGTNIKKTFTINKLDLVTADITISPSTVEWTGARIDEYEKVTVTYGDIELISDADDSTSYDYKIKVLKNGVDDILKDQGTYTLRIDAGDSPNCENYKEIQFTVTTRSLPNNYHHYYSAAGNKFVGSSWTYDSTNKRYVSVPDGTISTDTLTIYVYDVETVGTDNIPIVSIEDSEAYDSTNGTVGYELKKGTDYTVTVSNSSSAGSAEWSKTLFEDDTHALPTADSPSVTITGIGNYTASITLPYNIGKNINTLSLEVTYTMSGADLPTYTYKSEDADTVAWSYKYNGKQQVPSVTVYSVSDSGTKTKLTKNKAYTVSYTDLDGDEDTSINAGYKYVVITGTGDYCGTISQRYAITRKEISASTLKTNTESIVTGTVFTNESPMYATTDGTSSGTNVLTFSIADNSVSKLTSTSANTYLVETGLMNETDAEKFVGYYYGVYAGSAIEPSVKVTDNTLGTSGTETGVISSDDLEIGYGTDGQSSTVSRYVLTDGTVTSYTCSEITVGFKATSATDYTTTGNYYVPAGGTNTFHIQYLIVSHDISSDFEVQFVNALDGNKYDYDDGKAITPEIKVTNGTLTLTEDEDYTVSYLDDSRNATNILPGVATITVTGIGNYRGTKQLNFYIYGDLADTDTYYYDTDGNFIEGIPTQQYTGVAITKGDPQIYLVLPHQNDQTEDYVLTYGTHYQVGKSGTSTDSFVTDGTVYYEGLSTGYWSGSKDLSYDIEFEESEVRATNYESSYEFTGYDIEPDFGLNISTATMGTITYSRGNVTTTDLTSIGTITASIPYSIGTYSGTVTAEYEITARDLSKNDEDSDDRVVVTLAHEYPRYTGRVVEPPFTIYILSKNLKTGATQVYSYLTEYDATDNQAGDYEVDYGNYIYGDGKLTITGKSERLIGEMSKAYTIKLQSVANLRVTENTGDTITVEWVRDMFSNGTKLTLLKLNSTGEYTEVLETAISDNTYTFTGLTSSTTYKIVATAVANTTGGVIQSDPKEVIETTGIAAGKVKVVSKTTGKATVSWGTDGNVLIYYVYRAEDETSEGKLLAILPASTGKYTNSKLTSGKTYYYHIDGYTLVDGVLTKVNESEHVAVTIK